MNAFVREPTVAREVELLKDEAARGSRLVKQLLTFARADTHQPRPIDLAQVMRDSIPMLESLLRGHWTLRSLLPSEALVVHADRSQIEQVIINLVLNARDAMPDGGKVDTTLSADDDIVTLTVSDHGTGIDDRTLAHIFEPFFTTKTHGTGLGLSTVHSIVQQNGGTIDVSSVPSRGTAFTVRLPRT